LAAAGAAAVFLAGAFPLEPALGLATFTSEAFCGLETFLTVNLPLVNTAGTVTFSPSNNLKASNAAFWQSSLVSLP